MPDQISTTRSPIRPEIGISDGWTENLQPQELVLGLFGEYVRPGQQVWSGGLVALLGDLDFSPAASRIALNRLVSRGMLDSNRSGKFVHYTISTRLEAVHTEARRRLFSDFVSAPWAGDWTIVWYSVPDERRLERARLGRWLAFRGFGALQDGTRIAPGDQADDVRRLIGQMGLASYSKVFVGRLGSDEDLPGLVGTVWDLTELKRRYDLLTKAFAVTNDPGSPAEAFVRRTRAIEMFRQTVSRDPQLPDAVIGMDWRRLEAVAAFHRLQRALAARATAYFWQHAERNFRG